LYTTGIPLAQWFSYGLIPFVDFEEGTTTFAIIRGWNKEVGPGQSID
jgi:hypothetical protein